jgi:hypothetical protein
MAGSSEQQRKAKSLSPEESDEEDLRKIHDLLRDLHRRAAQRKQAKITALDLKYVTEKQKIQARVNELVEELHMQQQESLIKHKEVLSKLESERQKIDLRIMALCSSLIKAVEEEEDKVVQERREVSATEAEAEVEAEAEYTF